MKSKLFFLFYFIVLSVFSQTKLLSWNLENFGNSKSDQELEFIANTLSECDIAALQEVVAGNGGAKAVARLVANLNRKGGQWDYRISDPTSSNSYKTERYAFLWKTNKVKLKGKAWLEQKYQLEIDREPFMATFDINGKSITVAAFHAIGKSSQPEREIKFFKYLPAAYPELNLLFAGDFNCPQSHSVFDPLKKMGYSPILVNQKTSLKRKAKNGQYLASEFDNMFYKSSSVTYIKSGVLLFYKSFVSLGEAHRISDHIPVCFEFRLK